MAVAKSVVALLEAQGVEYWVVPHEPTDSLEQAARLAGIPPGRIARGVSLHDSDGVVFAVLPLTHLIDFAALKDLLGRTVEPAPARFVDSAFADSQKGTLPPLGLGYICTVAADEHLREFDSVYFEAGSHTELIRVRGADFAKLQGVRARWGRIGAAQEQLISEPHIDEYGDLVVPDDLALDVDALTPLHGCDVKRRIEQIYDLPPMPQMAQELLRLHGDPDADIQDLADIVQLDASLAAQVVRYARSPFFGYRGKIETIHDAITRVLGFDMVMHMALGIAAGQAFRNPPDGPLGLNEFWRHSTYAAALSQALVRHVPADIRPKAGLMYLSGLLHNFGFLLLGHLFQPEFYLLNKLVAANPNIPVTAIEKRVLGMGQAHQAMGMGHAEMGAWLMQAWTMPEEVVVTLKHHHDYDYRGDHWVYAMLVLLVNHLLKRNHIGDADSEELPESVVAALRVDPEEIVLVADQVLENSENLDAIARQLAA